MVFCDRILSLSIMLSRAIHVGALYFLFIAKSCSIARIYHTAFIFLSLMDIWVVDTLGNNAAMNIHKQICVGMFVLHFSRVYTWEGSCWSHGNSVSNLLRNYWMVFQDRCVILPPHQQCKGVHQQCW